MTTDNDRRRRAYLSFAYLPKGREINRENKRKRGKERESGADVCAVKMSMSIFSHFFSFRLDSMNTDTF